MNIVYVVTKCTNNGWMMADMWTLESSPDKGHLIKCTGCLKTYHEDIDFLPQHHFLSWIGIAIWVLKSHGLKNYFLHSHGVNLLTNLASSNSAWLNLLKSLIAINLANSSAILQNSIEAEPLLTRPQNIQNINCNSATGSASWTKSVKLRDKDVVTSNADPGRSQNGISGFSWFHWSTHNIWDGTRVK